MALSLTGLAACGGDARPRALRPASPADDAVEVAALLPEEAERCVVARPRALAQRRRALVLYASWAEPEVYEADLPLAAYATALAEGSAGRARRSYLRFTHAGPDVRARARELPVRWLDEPCEGLACRRPVARWVDERTLEIARREWPRRRLPVPTAECVRLARSAPQAFEVAVDATHLPSPRPMPTPRRVRRTLRADGGALGTRREMVFGDGIEARIYESWARGRASIPEVALMPLGPSRRRIERQGERVVVRDRRLWEELELALEDERLRRQALTLRRRRAEPTPLSRVDFENLAVVRHQIRLRQSAMARATGERRRRAAEELAALLQRGLEAHPGELGLARQLARLELEPLGRPARAVAVVDRVLAAGLADDPAPWQALRREASSHRGVEPFADALVGDGVAERAEARAVAEDLIALREAGVPYDWAEGAWRISRALAAPRRPPVRADAHLPFEGAVGALVGWARIATDAPRATVQVAVRVPRVPEVRAVGESRPELVVVRGPDGGASLVGALPSADLLAARTLGQRLADHVPPGPVDLTVELREPQGRRLARLRVVGTRQGEDLVVERVGRSLADAPWPALSRYLARPLAELPTALFPPPELTVRAESAEVAARLRRRAEPGPDGDCRVAGPVLRCRVPGRPRELGELLLRVARARIEAD